MQVDWQVRDQLTDSDRSFVHRNFVSGRSQIPRSPSSLLLRGDADLAADSLVYTGGVRVLLAMAHLNGENKAIAVGGNSVYVRTYEAGYRACSAG
jgi:hypothetical protein